MNIFSAFLFILLSQQESEFTIGLVLGIILKILIAGAIFICGLFIGRYMVNRNKKKEYRSNEDFKKKKTRRDLNNSEIQTLKEKYKELERENTEFRNEISQLKGIKVSPSFSQVELNNIESKTQEIKKSEQIAQQPEQKNQINSVFFEYPELDGSFKKDFGFDSKQAKTYFEIVYEDGHQEGKLKFVADRSSYSKIISLRDTSLRPVSEFENLGEIDRPSSIKVIEDGMVDIKEDRYIVKEGHKLKLRIS
jgi:hypothetical protein